MMHPLKATAYFGIPLRGFVVLEEGHGLSYTTRCEGIIRYGVH